MLPNFFVVGAQKAGTTSLHHLIKDHPQIYLPEIKETKFFVKDNEWNQGVDYYKTTHFANTGASKAVGEVDPEYLFYEGFLPRLQSVYGELDQLKFIVVLRNPVERAYSHYLMSKRRGHETLDFKAALKAEAERIGIDYHHWTHFSYVSRGLYHQQISRLLAVVPATNVLILFSEDLKSQTLTTLRRVFEFLDIDPEFQPPAPEGKHNVSRASRFAGLRQVLDQNSPVKRWFRRLFPFVKLRQQFKRKLLKWNENGKALDVQTMDPATRNLIRSQLDNDIKALENLCGRNLDHWV